MKKFLLLGFLFLFLTGCSKKENVLTGKDLIRQNWIDQKRKENHLSLYYELEDGTKLYSSLKQIKYINDEGKEKELKKELKSKHITMEEFVKRMAVYRASNDGGSVYFETTENFSKTKFYLAWCNSLEGNGGIKDIFIVEDKEKVLTFCVIENEEYYK